MKAGRIFPFSFGAAKIVPTFPRTHSSLTGHANILVLILFRLFSLVPEPLIVLNKINQLLNLVSNIDALIFAKLVNKRKVLQ